MEAKGKTLLKVMGILMIIGGAISIIGALVLLVGGGLVAGGAAGVDGATAAGVGAIAIVAGIFALATGVLELIAGIIGVKNCENLDKAGLCIGWGVVVTVIALVSLIISAVGHSFDWKSIVSLVLPVLYLVGAFQNKQSKAS